MTVTQSDVEAFLCEECNLLDERRFEDWLQLFEPDAFYYMPCRPDADRAAHHSALIDDDLQGLRMRVNRLSLPNAHTERPTPRAARILSNVTILSQQPLIVRAKLVMHEFQRRNYARDDYRLFCATVRYGLSNTASGLRIRSKHVDLIDAGGSPTIMATPI